MGSPPSDRTAFNPSKATKSPIRFGYLASVHAQWAGEPICGTWRVLRKLVGTAAAIMHPFNLWPDLFKMISNTARTEADHIRNRFCTFITIPTSSHIPN